MDHASQHPVRRSRLRWPASVRNWPATQRSLARDPGMVGEYLAWVASSARTGEAILPAPARRH